MQSSMHDFGKYFKVLPSYLLHNVMQYLLRRVFAIESKRTCSISGNYHFTYFTYLLQPLHLMSFAFMSLC